MMRFVGLLLCGILGLGGGSVLAQEVEQDYMAVFVKGERVGYHNKIRKMFADSVVTTEFMTFSVKVDEGTIEKLSIDETVESRDGKLIRFRHETAKGTRLFRLAGRRDGDRLRISLVSDGQKHQRELDWSEPALFVEGRYLLAKQKGLKPGTHYQYLQFFTSDLSVGETWASVVGEATVDVLDKKMKLIETKEDVSLQGRTVTYIVYRDASLKPFKIVIPSMFIEMVSCSEAFAMTPLDADDN
jgi:hypothetical protein